MASGDQKGDRKAALYAELYKYCQSSDFERAVKACNRGKLINTGINIRHLIFV